MYVWSSLNDWQARRLSLDGCSMGFVPTMGALHRGHASLVERARRENQVTLVSIFVNPSQFNDPKDLEQYPRTLDGDLDVLRSLGVSDVLLPPVDEMYPTGEGFRMEPSARFATMEGAFRPGFLSGVLTVVLKLLNLARADRAYFGEKDYQQLQAVRELTRAFFIPTKIVACPTIREESGLAMSSRNLLLASDLRGPAANLYRYLTDAPNCEEASELLAQAGFRVEYVEEHDGRRFAAAYWSGVRLIDNVPLGNEHGECC